ncbi:MAG TPA: hypothetical protein VNS50_00960 [Ginsengibacter sp.]|nr:hypothetical protein [Ginsengibacter sp.]
MKFLLLITLFFITTTSLSFGQYQELYPGNTGVYNGVNTNGMTLLSQTPEKDENSADIRGNAFWDADWKPAILYTDNFKILVPKVKLNLYKDRVYYTTPDSVVMIADDGQIKGITFFKTPDTTNVIGNFVYLKTEDDKDYHYYEVMNSGKAQLVKKYQVTLFKPPFDPISGTTDWNYVTKVIYYIYFNGKLSLLKGNNKEAVFSILHPGASSVDWLDKNRNKLKSAPDILDFLKYYNSAENK